MTNRVSYAPQDFQKMCEQAERDQETKRLVILIERVKRQIAERKSGELGRRPATTARTSLITMGRRSAPFER